MDISCLCSHGHLKNKTTEVKTEANPRYAQEMGLQTCSGASISDLVPASCAEAVKQARRDSSRIRATLLSDPRGRPDPTRTPGSARESLDPTRAPREAGPHFQILTLRSAPSIQLFEIVCATPRDNQLGTLAWSRCAPRSHATYSRHSVYVVLLNIHVCTHICAYMYIYIYIYIEIERERDVCMYMMCVCICVYTYIYIYVYCLCCCNNISYTRMLLPYVTFISTECNTHLCLPTHRGASALSLHVLRHSCQPFRRCYPCDCCPPGLRTGRWKGVSWLLSDLLRRYESCSGARARGVSSLGRHGQTVRHSARGEVVTLAAHSRTGWDSKSCFFRWHNFFESGLLHST